MSLKFGRIRPQTTELAAPEGMKISENDVITFSPLFFIIISSSAYLQIMRTCIKAWISLNFGQIPPLTRELAALEHLKIDVTTFFLVAIKDTHIILDEFEFRPDRTTDYGVNCP